MGGLGIEAQSRIRCIRVQSSELMLRGCNIMPHNYDVAMDTGDHVTFTWILYGCYVCVHINIFVYTFRYGYPKKN